jgi:hypothetical protein
MTRRIVGNAHALAIVRFAINRRSRQGIEVNLDPNLTEVIHAK